ncbi:DUF6009 family protein [Kitasatospora sp. NPDC088779]|uniref:DUF6009 family protein n=1 Tax=Kitasatospora sp. NPDC088779 TaxID=3154964 RepID=UPI00341BBAE1
MTCENSRRGDTGTDQGPNETTTPPTRLLPAQVAAETDIVWLEPVDDLPYVRESLYITKRRRGRPPYHGTGRLVGYADLDPAATATRDSGRFDRRIFVLQPTDRGQCPDTPYTTYAPLEAVDPHTVAPGRPGRLTERAWGSPPTYAGGPGTGRSNGSSTPVRRPS